MRSNITVVCAFAIIAGGAASARAQATPVPLRRDTSLARPWNPKLDQQRRSAIVVRSLTTTKACPIPTK